MVEKELGKDPLWTISEALKIFLLFVILTVALLTLPYIFPHRMLTMCILILSYSLPGIIPLLWLKYKKRMPWQRIGIKPCSKKYYLKGLLLILGLLLVWFLIVKTKIAERYVGQDFLLPSLSMIIVRVILVPVSEEIYYRGVLFSACRNRFGFIKGLLISSIVFSLVHYSELRQNEWWYISFLYFSFTGAIFAWLYNSSRSLLPAIFCHSVVSLIGIGLIHYWSKVL